MFLLFSIKLLTLSDFFDILAKSSLLTLKKCVGVLLNMKKEWNTVEVLRHVRHDWLNKLQLIKGNIDLNKMDRVKEIIGEIVVEAQHETKLSNLNLPHFTSLLLLHNWEMESFKLEFEVIDDYKRGILDDNELTQWTSTFFTILNESIKSYYDNHLILTIEQQQDGLRFFFDFCGIIENKESLEPFLHNTSFGIDVIQFDMNERELTLEVMIPYK